MSSRLATRALRAAPRAIQTRLTTTPQLRTLATVNNNLHFPISPPNAPSPFAHPQTYNSRRFASSTNRSAADQLADRLQGMYAEAKDEFEIAVESTEAHAVYAQSDRDATREELEKLKKAYKDALDTSEEVRMDLEKRPISQRIRELENAVEELERRAREEH